MADRRGSAVWNGDLFGGSGTVTFESSGAAGPLPVTWAARTEESGGKTSPEELIAAAHAACFSMSLSNILAQAGNAPEELRTSATATFAKTDAGFRITRMALEVTGTVPGIDQAAFDEKAQEAKVACPVSNAVTGIPDISVTATLA
jgi:osmotically inducible protein OsmC